MFIYFCLCYHRIMSVQETELYSRVQKHYMEYHASCTHYGFNVLMTAVGVGLIAFSIVMIVKTHNIFAHCLYSGVGVAGGAISWIAIGWIIQFLRDSRRYEIWIRENDCRQPSH